MKARYFIQLLIVSALWGASFPMLRVAAPEMGSNVAAMLRVAIGTVTLSLIMRAVGDRMIIAPPLTMTRAQIDEMMALIRQCLDATSEQLKAEGLWG